MYGNVHCEQALSLLIDLYFTTSHGEGQFATLGVCSFEAMGWASYTLGGYTIIKATRLRLSI